jgi:hypothetical protein
MPASKFGQASQSWLPIPSSGSRRQTFATRCSAPRPRNARRDAFLGPNGALRMSITAAIYRELHRGACKLGCRRNSACQKV